MTFSSNEPGLSGLPPGAGYCIACGVPYGPGQMYCGQCGRRLTTAQDEVGAGAASFGGAGNSPPPWQATGSGTGYEPYGSGATAGAVVLTVFLPVIALIVALVLRSSEQGLRRRQFLKSWAIWSAVWTCAGLLIPIIALGANGAGPASGCQGGIDQTIPPSYQSSDGVHWTATYTCMNGGTETVSVPASQVPGG
jgi:hypothetical protein